MRPIINTPPNNARPPPAVSTKAMRAPSRASLRCDQNPISRNELILVSSQNTISKSRLPDSTMPSIAPMNSNRYAKKRDALSRALR